MEMKNNQAELKKKKIIEPAKERKWVKAIIYINLFLLLIDLVTILIITLYCDYIDNIIGMLSGSVFAHLIIVIFSGLVIGISRRMNVISFIIIITFQFSSLFTEIQCAQDLIDGPKVQTGIVEYVTDEGQISYKNKNHEYIIKLKNLDFELKITGDPGDFQYYKELEGNTITVVYQYRMRRIEAIK